MTFWQKNDSYTKFWRHDTSEGLIIIIIFNSNRDKFRCRSLLDFLSPWILMFFSYVTSFPVRFLLLLNFSKSSSNFLLMNEETWLTIMLPRWSESFLSLLPPHSGHYFNLLPAFLAVWWFFPPVRIFQFIYTTFRYCIFLNHIRFVDWNNSVSVNGLAVTPILGMQLYPTLCLNHYFYYHHHHFFS